ncbi:arginine--tRNA ligase, partial [Patescibacteria group bacterium]|nr:arginine--tRNA ligase [Patescibacteria group bacterium]
EAEISMVRKMVKFPEVLEKALDERKPHVIAGFLFEMCHEFNKFYSAAPVLTAESDEAQRTRLGIVQGFMHELKSGLAILGIPVLERM